MKLNTTIPRALSFLLSACIISFAIATCNCNSVKGRPAAEGVPFSVNSPSLGHVALDIGDLTLSQLQGAAGSPHKIAMVYASMYEAYALLNTDVNSVVEVCTEPLLPADSDISERNRFIGYAGYFALLRVLSSEPGKALRVHARMKFLGYSSDVVESHAAGVLVHAVLTKYRLNERPPIFQPRNPPSVSFDAQCDKIAASDAWQGQCVQVSPGKPCMSQKVMFTAFLNASLISYRGERRVEDLIRHVPSPAGFSRPLSDLPYKMSQDRFADQYLRTLQTSAVLDDKKKFVSEFFEPNAAIRCGYLALNEAIARSLSLKESLKLLYAVSAAARDAVVATVHTKLHYDTARPVTVLQCAYRNRNMRTWNAPYLGVRHFVNGKNSELWRPYLQTPGFPGYISGHSAVAGAASRVMSLFFKADRPRSANCATLKKGTSKIEPRIEKGAFGYIKGITDIPNSGPASVGYSPAKDVSFCWSSFSEFAELLGKSREYGGIHIPADNYFGLELGRRVGDIAYELIKIENQTLA